MTPEDIAWRAAANLAEEGWTRDANAVRELVLEHRRLRTLCRRLVEINPEGRSREWWETMDEIAKIVANNRSG